MSLIDETEKTEFNLFPVEETLEEYLKQPITTTGASFKQLVINLAFNKRPTLITDRFNYMLNVTYGYCVKLKDFLTFVCKHEYPEIINTYITPINIQIPNQAFISNQLITYMKDGSSRLFPGFYYKPSLLVIVINNELYIMNHVCKYIDEVPLYIYYTQYFLETNFNPALQQAPNQIKNPEIKLMEYTVGIRPSITELFKEMNPSFKPTSKKLQTENITFTSNQHRHHNIPSEGVDIQEDYRQPVTKEELKNLLRKSREVDDAKLRLEEIQNTNKALEDRAKHSENNEAFFEKLYADSQERETDYQNKIKSLEDVIQATECQIRELIPYQVLYTENKEFIQRGRDFHGYDTTMNSILSEKEEENNILSQKINKLKHDIQEKDKIIQTKNQTLTNLEEDNKSLNLRVTQLEDLNKTQNESTLRLQNTLIEKINDIQTYKNKIKELTTSNNNFQNEIENFKESTNQLQNTLTEKINDIQTHKNKIKELTVSNNNLQNESVTLKKELESQNLNLTKRYQDSSTNNQKLRDEINQLKLVLTNKEANEISLQNEVHHYQAEINKYNIQLEQNKKLMLLKENSLKELEQTLQPLLDNLTRLNEEDSKQKAELTKLRIQDRKQKEELTNLLPETIINNNQQNKYMSNILEKYLKHRYDKDTKFHSTLFNYNGKLYVIFPDNKIYELSNPTAMTPAVTSEFV